MGKYIAKLHKEGIIHGDLTTSNIIVKSNDTDNLVLVILIWNTFSILLILDWAISDSI